MGCFGSRIIQKVNPYEFASNIINPLFDLRSSIKTSLDEEFEYIDVISLRERYTKTNDIYLIRSGSIEFSKCFISHIVKLFTKESGAFFGRITNNDNAGTFYFETDNDATVYILPLQKLEAMIKPVWSDFPGWEIFFQTIGDLAGLANSFIIGPGDAYDELIMHFSKICFDQNEEIVPFPYLIPQDLQFTLLKARKHLDLPWEAESPRTLCFICKLQANYPLMLREFFRCIFIRVFAEYLQKMCGTTSKQLRYYENRDTCGNFFLKKVKNTKKYDAEMFTSRILSDYLDVQLSENQCEYCSNLTTNVIKDAMLRRPVRQVEKLPEFLDFTLNILEKKKDDGEVKKGKEGTTINRDSFSFSKPALKSSHFSTKVKLFQPSEEEMMVLLSKERLFNNNKREIKNFIKKFKSAGTLGDFDFNVLVFDDLKDITAFIYIVFVMLNLDEIFTLSHNRVIDFILTVAFSYYTSNPYHSLQHVADLVAMLVCIVVVNDLYKYFHPIDILGLLIAIIGHDCGHSGLTNVVIEKLNHLPKETVENLPSLMELMSANLTLTIIERCQIFNHLDSVIQLRINDIVTKCIMATALSNHSCYIKEFEKLPDLSEIEVAWDKVTDEIKLIRLSYLELFMKFLDIGNPLKKFDLAVKWGNRYYKENYLIEQDETLPTINPLDYSRAGLCQHQINFISFLVKPQLLILQKLFPSLWPFAERMQNNVRNYKYVLTQLEVNNN
eukprot:TRINITY_DN2965_c0_g1_i2.p1 TRINITY_DN2965_c0_g1~~TRINITY_DN2965_c0_g1_i2.p1  ORF type:complete len:725 (+),score=153.50 TRINITY_DN2965_c0_g1_i2:88-2262(+)